jgi:hypothetical protein
MMKRSLLSGLLLIPLLGGSVWTVNADESTLATPQVLGEESVDLPGSKVKVRVLKLSLPKGWKQSEKIHPLPGPRYVLKGRIRVVTEVKKEEFGPGQVFWENGVVATSENISDGEVDLLVTEMVPEPAALKGAHGSNGKSVKGATK